jgi:hypothetical protein
MKQPLFCGTDSDPLEQVAVCLYDLPLERLRPRPGPPPDPQTGVYYLLRGHFPPARSKGLGFP